MTHITGHRPVDKCPACGGIPAAGYVTSCTCDDPKRADTRDRVRLMIEEGRVQTWADGFGRFYARVPASVVFPMAVARLAIQIELMDRYGAVPLPKVVRVPDYDDNGDRYDDGERHAYREADDITPPGDPNEPV